MSVGQANLDFGDYAYTLQDVDRSANNIIQTENMLNFVDKPAANNKNLTNPNFSFLRQLVLSIFKSTGYQPTLFTPQDKDMKALSNDLMAEFIKKFTDVVGSDLGVTVDIDPQKVIEGKETDKTRTALQLLALAAHMNVATSKRHVFKKENLSMDSTDVEYKEPLRCSLSGEEQVDGDIVYGYDKCDYYLSTRCYAAEIMKSLDSPLGPDHKCVPVRFNPEQILKLQTLQRQHKALLAGIDISDEPEPLIEGQKVQCNYKQQGTFYGAVIAKVNNDGSVDVIYDVDKELEKAVKPDCIRVVGALKCRICDEFIEPRAWMHLCTESLTGVCDSCFVATTAASWEIRFRGLNSEGVAAALRCPGSLVRVKIWDGKKDDSHVMVNGRIAASVETEEDDTGESKSENQKSTDVPDANLWDIQYENADNLGFIEEFGQKIACNVSEMEGSPGRFFIRHGHVYWEKRETIPAEPKEDQPKHVCVFACGIGAKVAFFEEEADAADKDNPADQVLSRIGTVVDFMSGAHGGKYAIRIDNTDEIVHASLTPQNAMPEWGARANYTVGQRLMLLADQKNQDPTQKVATMSAGGATPWVDADVRAYLGSDKGSRYVVEVVDQYSGRREIEVDLNRFNHSLQKLKSVEEYERERLLYRTFLLTTRRRVVDSITGRSLDIVDQTVNVGLTDQSSALARALDLTSMKSISKHLSAETTTRAQGAFPAQPVLVTAAAGTGKTWGVQQLEYCLGEKPRRLEGLPFVIRGQDLSNMVSRGGQQVRDEDGAALLVQYIKDKFSSNAKRRNMLLQALSNQTLVLIFDGVDEVLELNECVQRLFSEELVAMRYRFVVTSRPIGVSSKRFKHGMITIGLQPLTHDQIQFSVQQQLQGDAFFLHLFAFKKLREEQDNLYYTQLAPRATTRKMLGDLGARHNLLFKDARVRNPDYDPEARQRMVGHDRFVATRDSRKPLSNAILEVQMVLEERDPKSGLLMAERLQNVVEAHEKGEGEELDDDVRDLSEPYFGGEEEIDEAMANDMAVNPHDFATKKTLFRHCIRLVRYTMRMRKESKKDKAAFSKMYDGVFATGPINTTTVWRAIADGTDEGLYVAEQFQAAFHVSIKTVVREVLEMEGQEDRDVSIHHAPLKDAVRYEILCVLKPTFSVLRRRDSRFIFALNITDLCSCAPTSNKIEICVNLQARNPAQISCHVTQIDNLAFGVS